MSIIVELVLQFSILSLLAFGGINALLPEIQRITVRTHHWMNDATFVHLFAIAQAAPGPNFLIVTLIGWHVAGLAGAFAATFAACVPSSPCWCSCSRASGTGPAARRGAMSSS